MEENQNELNLSPKAARLVAALMQGLSLANAAAIVGVSISTARRIRQSPAVSKAILAGADELVERTRIDLLSKTSAAIAVLHDLAISDQLPPQIRRSAADSILSHCLRAVDLGDRRELQELREILLEIREKTNADSRFHPGKIVPGFVSD